MSDCKGSYFVQNSKVLPVADFDEKLLSGGCSVYEVIRVIEGMPLFIEDHLERLFTSLTEAGLDTSLTTSEMNTSVLQLISSNNRRQGNIRVVLHYQGTCERKNGVFLAYYTGHNYPTPEQYKNGVDTALLEGKRDKPHAKIIDIGLRNSIEYYIRERNVYEALLVNENGCVTEGSKSNFFAVRGNSLITAPGEDVLQGITRKYIFLICREEGIPIRQEKIRKDDLLGMDAAFISGTSPRILPVRSINGIIYDVDHVLVTRLIDRFDKLIEDYVSGSHNNTFST